MYNGRLLARPHTLIFFLLRTSVFDVLLLFLYWRHFVLPVLSFSLPIRRALVRKTHNWLIWIFTVDQPNSKIFIESIDIMELVRRISKDAVARPEIPLFSLSRSLSLQPGYFYFVCLRSPRSFLSLWSRILLRCLMFALEKKSSVLSITKRFERKVQSGLEWTFSSLPKLGKGFFFLVDKFPLIFRGSLFLNWIT